MTDKYKLLPCPFCGSQHLRKQEGNSNSYIECKTCGTYGPNEPYQGAWNTRNNTDALTARDARVREQALREAAEICFEYSKDHGSGMFDRHSAECANRICALIALIQKDRTND